MQPFKLSNIERVRGNITDCVYADVEINGKTVSIVYDRIGNQTTINHGYILTDEEQEIVLSGIPYMMQGLELQ